MNDIYRHTSVDEKDLAISDSRSYVPTKLLYAKDFLYCNNRQKDASHQRSSGRTGEVRDYIKRIALKLSNNHSFVREPIMVINFLTVFVRAANI